MDAMDGCEDEARVSMTFSLIYVSFRCRELAVIIIIFTDCRPACIMRCPSCGAEGVAGGRRQKLPAIKRRTTRGCNSRWTDVMGMLFWIVDNMSPVSQSVSQ